MHTPGPGVGGHCIAVDPYFILSDFPAESQMIGKAREINNHKSLWCAKKIISEKKSRKLSPDYYLVLPWHFKKEILKRESSIRKKGCKFIFPLPNLKIY